ncbi:uncharacterized protein [Ptychodera flava]|uniref:uncharacterized protein n=1 Tax=Ptychodera flava TaxID=63121 RepID=UPI00396A4CA2
MLRIVLGMLSRGDEELFDGFVLETDTEGIKAYWKAIDFESGIDTYFVAIGTDKEKEDVLPYTDMGPKDGGYIGGLALNISDDAAGPVYYVSVKAQNGAGTMSGVLSSRPLKIVPGDMIGLVIDGPEDVLAESDDIDVDVDYQRESGTVTAQFSGFESVRHGIVHYEWAVGSSPLLDDIQPYISAGVILSEGEDIQGEGLHGMGQMQSLLPLEPSTTYYATVRAITGAGNVLEASSDGFTVDTTAPSIHINTIGVSASADNSTTEINDNDFSVYQKTSDALSASWRIEEEESSVIFTEFCFGSYPGASDIFNCTGTTNFDNIPNALVHPNPSRTNILTLRTINKVGLGQELTRGGGVTVDPTPPVTGKVICPLYIRSVDSLTCTWTDFVDSESGIAYYEFAVGTAEADDSIFAYTFVDSSVSEYDARGFASGPLKPGIYFVTVSATNHVGDSAKGYSSGIVVDETPPIAGNVMELSGVDEVFFDDTKPTTPSECFGSQGCKEVDANCQKSVDRILVAWQPFQDPDSPIVRYQVAVGTTAGGTQIRSFHDVDSTDGLRALVTNIDLYDVPRVFVSVRGYNAAGLYATGTSNGVYISRVSAGLPPIGTGYVWDGNEDRDLDFQDNAEQLSGQWSFNGDPCPISKYEWSILRFDGSEVQPMTELPEGMTYGVNDALNMKDGESYYVVVRATNLLGYSYSLRSDGITIQREPLLPGHVRDGDVMGYDINFQASVKYLAGNWDAFGIHPSRYTEEELGNFEEQQVIDHYEVAVGTDRRYPNTRDNVHPFFNVGLNTSHTFHGLNLVPRRLTYYITVRGYSTSTAMAEMTSNGIVVGVGGTVLSAGEIDVPRFIASRTTVSISWGKFEFGMPVLFYQLGIASDGNFTDTVPCSDLQSFDQDNKPEDGFQHLFNAYPLINTGKDTLVTMTTLQLKDKTTYSVVVIATDESAQCSLVTRKFSVDLTPPEEGTIQVGAFSEQAMAYTSRGDMLVITWDGYRDDESGIKSYSLSIYDGISCSGGDDHVMLQGGIEVLANDTQYTFVDLTLQPEHPYFVHLSCLNNAGLTTTTVSKPILLDLNDPVQGVVKDGPLFSDDIEYQSSTTRIEGVFLHLPNPSGSSCPSREYTFDGVSADDDWHSVHSEGVWNTAGNSVDFRPSQLLFDDSDGLSITMVRNVQKETMYSGAYYNTNPDVPAGGKYKVEILAASGDVSAVTSVVFWDGPDGVVGDFDAPVRERGLPEETGQYDDCKVCCGTIDQIGNSTNECLCNCTEYLLRPIDTTPIQTMTSSPETTEAGPPPWEIVEDEDPDDSFTGDRGLKSVPFRSMGFQLHPGMDHFFHINVF